MFAKKLRLHNNDFSLTMYVHAVVFTKMLMVEREREDLTAVAVLARSTKRYNSAGLFSDDVIRGDTILT